jgi:TonB-linked SusC/RagA family outer membrane protein
MFYKVICLRYTHLLFVLLIGFFIPDACFGQEQLEKEVSVNIENQSLDKALQQVSIIAGVKFIYSKSMVETGKTVSLHITGKLGKVLDELLIKNGISFELINGLIVLRTAERVPESKRRQSVLSVEVEKVGGRVLGEKGEALAGVSVSVRNTEVLTSTDAEGKFELILPVGRRILLLSHIGYLSKEVRTVGKYMQDIKLDVELKTLNDIVITGYSSLERRKLISSISAISGQQLTRRVATSPVSLLQGQLPGLQVNHGSGEPGGENIQLMVRGLGSFGAGSSPLVIINGIPGNLDMLNPLDIESVSLLKDAAAAAIYGSRGANGVILVKTKEGKPGVLSVRYDYNISIATATSLPDIIDNSVQYMELSNEARVNSSLMPIYTQPQIDLYRNATDLVRYPNHNWLDDLFRPAVVQNHHVGIEGGRDSSNYSISLGATEQPGSMIGFSYKKYTFALSLNSKNSKRISFATNIQGRYGDKVGTVNGSEDQFLSTLAHSPLYPPQASDGKWIRAAFANEVTNKNSIMVVGEHADTRTRNYYTQGNLALEIKILKGLSLQTRGGASYESYKTSSYTPLIHAYFWPDLEPAGVNGIGPPGLSTGRNDIAYTSIYSQLNYLRTWGEHSISAFGGAQNERSTFSYVNASRTMFPNNLLRELDAGATDGQTNSGSSQEWAIRSFYASANYDFGDRYLFAATVRRDGTSRLPSNSRYGNFYSFSAGWRLSEEYFLKQVSWLNDLKLRASFGTLGNQDIGVYPYQGTLWNVSYAFSGGIAPGSVPGSLVDPKLKWESTRSINLGLDITAFNRLVLSLDWYDKYTFDILRPSQVPVYVGLYAPLINNGALRNRGLELSAGYGWKLNQEISFNLGLNFQSYKNILESYGSVDKGNHTIRQEGHELDEYYVYLWEGIFQNQQEIDASPLQPVRPSPGDLKFTDVNKDGVINEQDRAYVNGRYPDFQYAVNLMATFKGLDLSVQFYGSQGQKNYVDGWGIEPFRQGSIPTKDWLNRWTPSNPTNLMPRIYVADGYAPVQNYPSTYFLKNASFLRIKSMQFGYRLPSVIAGKVGLRSLRIYVAADNLITITGYPGLDPERYGDGRYVTYPQNRNLTLGATIQF